MLSSRDGREAGVYSAALRATVAVIPTTAALSTIAIYVAPTSTEEGYRAVIIGSSIALFVWTVVALFYRSSIAASSASLRNYSALSERLGQLESRFGHLHTGGSWQEGACEDGVDECTRKIACTQASRECEKIKEGLEGKGMPWVKGTGYIELWHRIHRAEEALIMIEPRDAVLVGAMRDEMRLMDSNIVHRDSLLERLRCAAAMLDGAAEDGRPSYLAQPAQNPPPADQRNPAKGRAILNEVRYEINSFRDDVWEGIVHARGRLAATSVFTGFAAYTLVGFAVIVGAPESAIFWAFVYFLVGAIVGLFARLQADATADTAVDDYGLSNARLAHAPLFSGLAAVGGVLIASVLDTQIPTSESGLLDEIFIGSPSLLIVAAVFGLTPDLLIQRLAQQAEKYKADLKSTQPGQHR